MRDHVVTVQIQPRQVFTEELQTGADAANDEMRVVTWHLGGALPLVVADPLIRQFGASGVAYLLSGLAVLSTVCLLLLKETKDRSLDAEAPAARLVAPA